MFSGYKLDTLISKAACKVAFYFHIFVKMTERQIKLPSDFKAEKMALEKVKC